MTKTQKTFKQTYFGLAALITALISALFLAAYLGVSQLNITPRTFSFWNNVTALVYCLVVPVALVFAVFAWRRPKDSRLLAGIAVATIGVPFLVLFAQFVSAISIP